MVGEDFLGLRELGIASELGMSGLSIPKKLLRPKAKTGAGSSLPYVESTAGAFLTYPLTDDFPVHPAEPSRQNPHHLSHRPPRSSHSNQHGWKTKSLDYCDHTTSLALMPSHNPKLPSQDPHLSPQMVQLRLEALRLCKAHRLFQDCCCNHLSPFHRYHTRPYNSLHNLIHRQHLSFQTMCPPLLKQRWVRSGRSPVGSRRILPQRRNQRRRRTLRYLEPVAVVVARFPVL